MKKIFLVIAAVGISLASQAQKVEYKDGLLNVDGKDVAKIVKIKDEANMGLTSTFEVVSMTGEKLIIGAWAGDFEQDPNNNMDHFYRVSFLTASQMGIFTVSKLGSEKSFAKLIGKSGVIVDGKLDEAKVREFIAKKGRTPKIAMDYTIVNRDRSWPIDLKADKSIEQQSKKIGTFIDKTPKGSDVDVYEFALPSGVVIAKVKFTGGNNAQNFEVHTMKDNYNRFVPSETKDKITIGASSIDRNQWVLERITKWLVANQYL